MFYLLVCAVIKKYMKYTIFISIQILPIFLSAWKKTKWMHKMLHILPCVSVRYLLGIVSYERHDININDYNMR